MDPAFWSSLVFVGGACLLALAAVRVSRNGARFPDMAAQLATNTAEIEALQRAVTEAVETATKARTIASRRQTKREREILAAETEPHVQATTPKPEPESEFAQLYALAGGRGDPSQLTGTDDA